MNDSANYQPSMSASERRQHEARIKHILQVASATNAAMEVNKSIHEQGLFDVMSAMNQGQFTLQAYLQNHADDSAMIVFEQWQIDLLSEANQIYSIFGNKIQQLLQSIPEQPQQYGFFEELGNQILYLLSGENTNSEQTHDQIMQLGQQVRSALSNSTRNHTEKLRAYLENR